jgi:CCR4-NOT transcription complex subunit 2
MGRMDQSDQPPQPLIRPVQQILSSPVDKWGLKALLYEIRDNLGKDRGSLLFGEDLVDLGLDMNQEE